MLASLKLLHKINYNRFYAADRRKGAAKDGIIDVMRHQK
jgi:hypothetical protein